MPDAADHKSKSAEVIFLGACERAMWVRDAHTGLSKWNAIGLQSVVSSFIYPRPLTGVYFAFAVRFNDSDAFNLELVDEQGRVRGTFGLEASPIDTDIVVTELGDDTGDEGEAVQGFAPFAFSEWLPLFLPMGKTSIIIEEPGTYVIRPTGAVDNTEAVGRIRFVLVEPAPFTPERIAAIKSDPRAAKAAQMAWSCKLCNDGLQAYTAFERSSKLAADGYVWFQDLPDRFVCKCGRTDMNLQIIRRNMYTMLGSHRVGQQGLSLSPQYETSALLSIRGRFHDLLASRPAEEAVQQFIANNQVLLHPFAPERLFLKPAIIGLFKADFGILTPQKELRLVELEKPDLQLLKNDGGRAAALTHAFDQVEDWLHTVDEHRLAVLEALGLQKNEVSRISGIVIAGRDAGYDPEHLRKLKGRDWGRSQFFTYDDLLFALDALVRSMP